MATKLVHVGFHNFIAIDRVYVLLPSDSAVCKRIIRQAKNEGFITDMTAGRRAKAAIIMDNGHIVLTAISPQTIGKWLGARRCGADGEGDLGEENQSQLSGEATPPVVTVNPVAAAMPG